MQADKPGRFAYVKNQKLITELRGLYQMGVITKQELLTFRGQALNGDEDGAHKGLAKLVKERKGL